MVFMTKNGESGRYSGSLTPDELAKAHEAAQMLPPGEPENTILREIFSGRRRAHVPDGMEPITSIALQRDTSLGKLEEGLTPEGETDYILREKPNLAGVIGDGSAEAEAVKSYGKPDVVKKKSQWLCDLASALQIYGSDANPLAQALVGMDVELPPSQRRYFGTGIPGKQSLTKWDGSTIPSQRTDEPGISLRDRLTAVGRYCRDNWIEYHKMP